VPFHWAPENGRKKKHGTMQPWNMKTSHYGLLMCCLALCPLSNAGEEGRITPDAAEESRPTDGGNASGKAIANDDLEKDWETLYRLGEMRSAGCFRIGERILNKHPEEIKARLIGYASGDEKRTFAQFGGFAIRLLMRTRMEDPDVRKLIIGILRRSSEFSPNPGYLIWYTAGKHGSLEKGSTLRAMVKEDLFGSKEQTAAFFLTLKERIEKNTATREEIVDFLQWCHHAAEGRKIQRWYAAELRRLGSEPDGK
jgi:hypothetical protein